MSVRRRARVAGDGQLDMTALLFGPGSADRALDAPTPIIVNHAKRNTAPAVPTPRKASDTLAPIYTIKLVQTGSLPVPSAERPRIRSPRDAAAILDKYLEGVDREHFVVLLLDTKGALIGISTVSIGDLSSALVHPREVFKPAILANAASILLAHNHPSGDPSPSPEDTAVTRRIIEAGELLGIDVRDHVVIGDPGRWVSLKEKGLCL